MTPDSRHRWTPADIPDQTGRTVLVTGANAGLGLSTTAALTARGARVIMACRDRDRAAAARDGRDATTPMVARKGRASYLGERSKGHQDPGATSTTYLFEALASSLDKG